VDFVAWSQVVIDECAQISQEHPKGDFNVALLVQGMFPPDAAVLNDVNGSKQYVGAQQVLENIQDLGLVTRRTNAGYSIWTYSSTSALPRLQEFWQLMYGDQLNTYEQAVLEDVNTRGITDCGDYAYLDPIPYDDLVSAASGITNVGQARQVVGALITRGLLRTNGSLRVQPTYKGLVRTSRCA